MLKSLFNTILLGLILASSIGYVGYQLAKPDFLIKQAKSVKLYEQVTGNITSFLPEDAIKGLPLSKQDVQSAITQSVSADTFYNALGQAAGGYTDYLTGRNQSVVFAIDLTEAKRKLTDQLAAKLIADYDNLPVCKTSELKNWDATNSFPTCKLPSSNVQTNDVNTLLTNQAAKSVSQLPDKLTAPATNSSLQQNRRLTMAGLQGIRLAWVLTAVFILLYLLVFRSRAFLSLAIIFILVGLFEVAFSLVVWDWLKQLAIDYINTPGKEQITGLASDLIGNIVEVLKTLMGDMSIASLSAGGFFLILWAFSHFHRKPATTTTTLPRS